MGGTVSSGRSNDELIDNLVEGHLIKTPLIERVFRCIDRGLYYLPSSKESAYRDLAWRDGVIHISAPCIYTRVMENLELKENLSFLNIGSGTGYLSSMVGLILGSNGINHNIEIHKELIDYAKQKTIEFVNTAVNFDDFDYCVPKFVHGNCMNLCINSDTLLYDRIYVGAGVSEVEEQILTTLLKVDGILVMPINDSLVKIKRVDEKTFSKKSIMTVSFASLITNNTSQDEAFTMPRLNPLSLQEICRFKIRQQLRKAIQNEHNNYYEIQREKSTFNPNKISRSLSNDENESNDSSDPDEDEDENRNNDDEFPMTRFERIFRHRHINNVHENNVNLENQLRMMIYGHYLDTAASTNRSTDNYENSDSIINNDNDEQAEREMNAEVQASGIEEEIEEEEDEEMHMMNSDELISTAVALMEVSASFQHEEEREDEEERGIPIVESISNDSDLNNLASSIESIENSNFSDSSRSIEQPIDENSISSSIPRSTNVLAIGYSKRSIPIRRKRQVSSGYQSTSTDFSSSLNENNNIKINSDESNGINQKHESDNNDSDHYFDDDNDEDDYELEKKIEPVHETAEETKQIFEFGQIIQASNCLNDIMNDSISSGNQNASKNLLREKIMQLPVSEALKHFLLYYRKI